MDGFSRPTSQLELAENTKNKRIDFIQLECYGISQFVVPGEFRAAKFSSTGPNEHGVDITADLANLEVDCRIAKAKGALALLDEASKDLNQVSSQLDIPFVSHDEKHPYGSNDRVRRRRSKDVHDTNRTLYSSLFPWTGQRTR